MITETLEQRQVRAVRIIAVLQEATVHMPKPASHCIVQEFGRNPFLVLISCLLSLRTKDTVSLPASQRLFRIAQTPHDVLQIPQEVIASVIYPVGFYKRKAALLHTVSADLIQRFDGQVPQTEKDLLSIKGVGRKTMNLVLGEGFEIPAICVDTHVHRISNRLGLVTTRTPEETERELKKLLPSEYWIAYNHLLVMWGQNVCVPISPFVSRCAVSHLCPKIGVQKYR